MSEPGPLLLSGLFLDPEFEFLFSPGSTLRQYRDFERILTVAEARAGLIPWAAADAIGRALLDFEPGMEDLKDGLLRDGVAVPAFVRQLRARVGEPYARFVHFGATSQDVIDTSLVLAIRDANVRFERRLAIVIGRLEALAERFGAVEIIGRTRMQSALPIWVTDRVAAWRSPLDAARRRLPGIRGEVEALQLGGPVGDRRGFGDKGDAVAAVMAREMDLANAPCWHTDRSRVVLYGGWLVSVAGACGKIGQDILLMAQGGEIRLAGSGTSSAMPHKQNPVQAEALVALARQATTLAGGLPHALVHEQERSGVAWSLEWLILPPLCQGVAASLRVAHTLLDSIERFGCD